MANKKNTSKKPKKEIKDSVDVSDIKKEEAEQVSTSKSEKQETELKTQRSFKERYVDFVTNHRVPIVSFCYRLNHVDFKKYKEDPNGLSNDTLFIKDASNKKRFILRIVYLIVMILLGLTAIGLGVCFVTGAIPLGSMGQNGISITSGMFMAFGIVILGFFI